VGGAEPNTSDISLFDWLKNQEGAMKLPCSYGDCGKPRLIHTDYYYHASGCVEITYQEEAIPGRQQDYRVYVYCTCRKCNQTVISRREMPDDVLEMSFYKVLEQFFYNQEIVSH